MTELEAKRILGRELAESWLRMPEASRDTLRLLLKEDELRAVAVLEGHPLPDPPPEADLDSVLTLPRQAPIKETVTAEAGLPAAVLPPADFTPLRSPPPPPPIAPALEPPLRRLPEPDFSLLYGRRFSYRPLRFREVRRAGSCDVSSCCLVAVAVYLIALYVFLNYLL